MGLAAVLSKAVFLFNVVISLLIVALIVCLSLVKGLLLCST